MLVSRDRALFCAQGLCDGSLLISAQGLGDSGSPNLSSPFVGSAALGPELGESDHLTLFFIPKG